MAEERRAGVTRIALVALVVVAAACGSDAAEEGIATLEAGAEPGAAGSDAELNAEEAILGFTECLRVEGVPISDPEFDDEGNLRLRSMMDMAEGFESFDPDDLRGAFDACSEYLAGVAQLFTNMDRTVFEDRLLVYASCMRENGYDMADPDFGGLTPGSDGMAGEGEGMGPFGQLDVDDPAFTAANEICLAVFGETIGPGGFGPPGEREGG